MRSAVDVPVIRESQPGCRRCRECAEAADLRADRHGRVEDIRPPVVVAKVARRVDLLGCAVDLADVARRRGPSVLLSVVASRRCNVRPPVDSVRLRGGPVVAVATLVARLVHLGPAVIAAVGESLNLPVARVLRSAKVVVVLTVDAACAAIVAAKSVIAPHTDSARLGCAAMTPRAARLG